MRCVDDIHPISPPPFRRLAISDLLLLTLIVGLTLSSVAWEFKKGFEQPRVYRLAITLELLDYVFSAVLAFGLITIGYARIRGLRWRMSPGHWLILTMGPVAAYVVILINVRPLVTVYWTRPRRWQTAVEEGLFVVVLIATMAVAVVGAWRLNRWWRWVLCAVLLQQLSLVLWTGMYTAQAFQILNSPFLRRHVLVGMMHADLLIFASVVIAATVDLLQRERRDWLHWTGVLSVALASASRVINWKGMMIRWWSDLINYLY